MMKFITRAYNTIKLNELKGTLTKISSEERLGDEINFYRSLPPEFKVFYPRLCGAESSSEHCMELEYYPFQNLGQLLLNEDFSEQKWITIANTLSYMLKKFETKKYPNLNSVAQHYKAEMFLTKTKNEYDKLKDNFNFFATFCDYDSLAINNITYVNFEALWEPLKRYIEENYCDTRPLSFMHGDMCFSNMLYGFDTAGNVVLKLIDPRGAFGEKGCHGDVYYDLAKLRHSLEGAYEYFIYDKFDVSIEANRVSLTFVNDNRLKVLEIFNKYLFQNFDQLKIKILEGLIFIGMCARHYDSLERQKAMYCVGVKILNECMSEIK